jgi:hypothetical protein
MFNLVMMMFIYGGNGAAPASFVPTAGTPIIVGTFNNEADCIKAASESKGIVNEKGPAQIGVAFACPRAK